MENTIIPLPVLFHALHTNTVILRFGHRFQQATVIGQHSGYRTTTRFPLLLETAGITKLIFLRERAAIQTAFMLMSIGTLIVIPTFIT